MTSSSPDWPTIQQLIDNGEYGQLTSLLAELDATQRKPLVAPLKAYGREKVRDWEHPTDGPAMAIAGTALLPDAASLASWLRRWRMQYFVTSNNQWHEREYDQWGRTGTRTVNDKVLALLVAMRDATFQQTLARQLAEKLSTDQGRDLDLFNLVETVRRNTKMAAPRTDGYLAQLVYASWQDSSVFKSVIIEDPRFIELVPRIFEVDAIGMYLAWASDRIPPILALVHGGTIDRAVFLDACIARLQRPGRQNAIRTYQSILEQLEPTIEELSDRRRDVIAMLPASISTLAAYAQHALDRVDQAVGLTADEMVEVTRNVLARSEKKLHKAQLDWATRYFAAHADAAGDVVLAVTSAFTHSAVDIQRAAARWISGRVAALSPAQLEDVLAAADALPADLRASIGDERGKAVAAPVPPTVPGRSPLEPFRAPEELTEQYLVMLTDRDRNPDGATLERVLEALVRFAAGDRDTLRRALAPVTSHDFYPWMRKEPLDRGYASSTCNGITLNTAISELIAAAIKDEPRPELRTHCGHQSSPTQHLLVHRVLDLAEGLRARPFAALVSFPSWSDGALSANDLADRLERAHAAGWMPVHSDLELALLRVGAANEGAIVRLDAIDSTAARRAAAWLRSGGPQHPAIRWTEQPRWEWDPEQGSMVAAAGLLATAQSADDAGHDYGDLWREISHQQLRTNKQFFFGGWDEQRRCWPILLPHHREVVAVNLGGSFSSLLEANARAEFLPLLAESGGPVGIATYLGIGYALSARAADARTDAIDALLILAAREQFDGAALGDVLARLVLGSNNVTLTRMISPLRDAVLGGAAEQVAKALAVLLGALLTSEEKLPSPLGDLLALTAEAVELSRVGVTIDGLADLAGRRGSSRQIVEARRLATVLGQRSR